MNPENDYLYNAGYQKFGNIMFQWGMGRNESDGTVRYSFPINFKNSCWSLVISRHGEGISSAMGNSHYDNMCFWINRENDISGRQDFSWIAIGDC